MSKVEFFGVALSVAATLRHSWAPVSEHDLVGLVRLGQYERAILLDKPGRFDMLGVYGAPGTT